MSPELPNDSSGIHSRKPGVSDDILKGVQNIFGLFPAVLSFVSLVVLLYTRTKTGLAAHPAA
jgi:hypothetical protein